MKQNVMNQTMILDSNDESIWLFREPLWKPWRLKAHELFRKLAVGTKTFWQLLSDLWFLRIIGNAIQGILCVFFVPSFEQEKIEQARMKIMQYRNIF